MSARHLTGAVAAVALLGLSSPALAIELVNLSFGPAVQQAEVGQVIEIEMLASTDGPAGQEFLTMQAVLQWDPAVMTLLGADDAEGPNWMMSDFFEDPDGINDSFLDGDAMWTALMSPTGNVEAPPVPDAVVLTTLTFEVVGPSAGSDLHYVDYLGDWGNTNVILSGGLHVTGDLSAAATVVVGGVACPADLDGNGSVGTADLLELLAAWGESGGPADLDGDGTVGTGDLLMLLSEWGACV